MAGEKGIRREKIYIRKTFSAARFRPLRVVANTVFGEIDSNQSASIATPRFAGSIWLFGRPL